MPWMIQCSETPWGHQLHKFYQKMLLCSKALSISSAKAEKTYEMWNSTILCCYIFTENKTISIFIFAINLYATNKCLGFFNHPL